MCINGWLIERYDLFFMAGGQDQLLQQTIKPEGSEQFVAEDQRMKTCYLPKTEMFCDLRRRH